MKLTGGEIIVKQLLEEHVPYVLGIPGHGILCFFDALRRECEAGKIAYIQVKHEQAATAIADGYFRVTGRPLATFASIGPGTLNTAIGLGTAYVDGSAFLQLCGDTHVHMKGVGVLQEVERYQDSNILRALEPLSKRSWRVENVKQLPRTIHRAFNQMLTGRCGPVAITLPMDVQASAVECELMKVQMSRTEARPEADPKSIHAALALMKKAKRPVILLGGGALKARVADKVETLARRWGAGVITTLQAKGAISEEFEQYCFHTGSKGTAIGVAIARTADVILALGTRFADETCCSYRKGQAFNFPDTKLIHVDIDPGEIGKNYGTDVGIVADVSLALNQLLDQFNDFTVNGRYLEEIKKRREDWFRYLHDIRQIKSDKLTISQVIGVMNDILPHDTRIVTSSGNTQAQLFQEYVYSAPYCNVTTGGFSTMGWALPSAIGVKLAFKDKPVVALMGDGDFLMIMQELATLVQYDIPVVVIVADNSGWMAIKDLQMNAFGPDLAFGNDFLKDGQPYSPDFDKMAESFGLSHFRAETADQLKEALQNALALNKPAFINVPVTREFPLTGGQTFGWWDVPIPTYMDQKRREYEAALVEETL
ncbi:MAG: thiamine pyrophosphate-binding protein [Bacilli bacterium]|jgi:acetolactate synthase-1/2/3 large subunit